MFVNLSWAVFLASSWTWCIGMFFPALLYRDFGSISWWLFTIPNIIGAASVPWILKNETHSADFTKRHDKASFVFSVVTISFQCFFVGWLMSCLRWEMVLALSAIILLMFVTAKSERQLRGWGMAIWIISFSAFIFFLNQHGAALTLIEPIISNPTLNLIGLGSVFLMGFAFCPYLDLTFHKARRQFPSSTAKWVFGFGFLFFFLIMLVFTSAYSSSVLHVFFNSNAVLIDAGISAVLIHMALQATFTAIAHRQCATELTQTPIKNVIPLTASASFILALALQRGFVALGFDVRELIYINFIAFYGFMAPTYLWIYTLKNQPNNIKSFFLATIFISAPFFTVGFLSGNGKLGYLSLIGFLIVFASRFIISGLTPKAAR